MPSALNLTQNFTRPDDGSTITNLYARLLRFTIDAHTQKYEVVINVYISQAAYTAGREPVRQLVLRSDKDFPSWATAFADTGFSVPLSSLRDWIYATSKTSVPAIFGGATDIA